MADLPEIPDYDIQAPLGQGGMASVFRAQHLRLRRLVALKIMHADLAARDEQFSARFLREARIAADLTHPNIVQVYDVNKHDEMHYIAMEYVNGGLLEERIKSYMDFDELVNIMSDVAKGLDFAHKKGYIHRDIKPANILFRESGEAVISDFGIAKALDTDTQMTELGSVVGTPSYMSPEQASGGTVDSRCDLYSLAVMAYRILTGRTPYSGETSLSIAVQHITEPIPQMPDTLKEVQPFLDKGMAKNPDERYATGAELVAALQECLDRIPRKDVSEAKTEVLTMLAESAEMEKAMAEASAAAAASGSRSATKPKAKAATKPVDVETTGSNTTISINMPQGSSRGIAIGAAALAVILAVGFLLWPKGISQADQARPSPRKPCRS
ncbi:MAG: serine/threonine protein kinase, partial [Halioglobus sp.]|nr:serine/threonine protein kinase [Halioglobus sp.]